MHKFLAFFWYNQDVSEKKKILVVDDDAAIVQILSDKLNKEGFVPIAAADGEEGLKMAESQHPDLILLDLLMPKMDGLEVMKKLRESSEWGKRLPIMIITNTDPDENMVRAVARDKPCYFFSKGIFDLDDMIKRIREELSRGSV